MNNQLVLHQIMSLLRSPLLVLLIMIFFLTAAEAGWTSSASLDRQPHTSSQQVGLKELVGKWHYRWAHNSYASLSSIAELREDFVQNRSQWSKITRPQNPPDRTGQQVVWFSTKLPNQQLKRPVLYVSGIDQAAIFYLRSKKIYQFGSCAGEPQKKDVNDFFYGFGWHIISLNTDINGKNIADYRGKRLFVKVCSDHMNMGLFGKTYLAEKRDATQHVYRSGVDSFVAGSIYIFLSLLALAFLSARRQVYRHLSLGLFVLNVGIYTIIRSEWKYLFAIDRQFWGHAELIALYLIPVGIGLYIESLHSWRRIGRYVIKSSWIIHLALALFAILSQMMGWFALLSFQQIFQWSLLITVAVWLTMLIRAAVTGRVEVKIFLIGVFVLVIFVFYDMLGVIGLLISWSNMVQIGVFLFIIVLIFLQVRHYWLTHIHLEEYSQKLKEKNINLKNALAAQRELKILHKDLKLAQEVQHSLLPQNSPQSEFFEVGVRYRPSMAVGGDYYDFVTIDKSRLGLFISDVSGHGIPAALISSLVKSSFESYSSYREQPLELLQGINGILYKNRSNYFATASYLYLDLSLGQAAFARAGHTPLLVWRQRQQTLEEMLPHGRAMGWLNDLNLEEKHFAVEAGDRLFLFTDGIVEAWNQREGIWGSERFYQLLHSLSQVPIEEVCDRVMAAVDQWIDSPRDSREGQDDIALLVLEITALDNGLTR